MKLKFKPSRQMVIILVIAAAAVAWGLLAGRSPEGAEPGPLDDAARQACTDFANGRDDADDKRTRLSLADQVMASARRTDNSRIADSASALGRNANDSDQEWTDSADALAAACKDAGWSAG
ncbi:hypothetical protein [Catenuloplanes atrovinosus]|uniref:hypothetical protein n=1 Tax=Catenuloplanes atrovinosus TaxID=137266 RepID=UPI00286D4517|nr:hypothetical protein [Catenuloplanes atrovinosus]